MRRLVADTHAVAWWLTAPERVGPKARRLLAAADAGKAEACVPAICLVEVALLHEKGRLRFGPDRVVALLSKQPGWEVLALDIEQAMGFAALPSMEDPMDRLVASAAMACDAVLVSADEAFDGIVPERAWD